MFPFSTCLVSDCQTLLTALSLGNSREQEGCPWSRQGHQQSWPRAGSHYVCFKLALLGPHFICCLHCRLFELVLLLKSVWSHPCCAHQVSSSLGSVSVLGLVWSFPLNPLPWFKLIALHQLLTSWSLSSWWKLAISKHWWEHCFLFITVQNSSDESVTVLLTFFRWNKKFTFIPGYWIKYLFPDSF